MEILKNMFEEFGKVFANPSPNMTAYDTPLEVLEAMWQVKWGHDWVPDDEIRKDLFWVASFARLSSNDLLESHRIITAPDGNSGLVYRLKKND